MKQLEERIQKTYDEAFAVAQRFVSDDEEHPPMVVRVRSDNGLDIAMLRVPKELWGAVQQKLLAMPDTDFVFFISEGWGVSYQKDPGESEQGIEDRIRKEPAPSEHPDRFEVISFVATSKSLARWSALCRIDRSTKTLIRDPLVLMNEGKVHGRVLPETNQGAAS